MTGAADPRAESAVYPPIADDALIGDCRSGALVSRDGSLDWLCWPRFDSPSLFASLLDAKDGGRFRVRLTGAYRTERRYLPETNVLGTVFHGPGGTFALRDLMPVSSETEKRAALSPEHEVLREGEGLAGEVEVEVPDDPRPDYARQRPRPEWRGALGLWCRAGRGALTLRSELPLEVSPDRRGARGRARSRAGERAYLSLVYSEQAPGLVPPLRAAARERLDWSARSGGGGRGRPAAPTWGPTATPACAAPLPSS